MDFSFQIESGSCCHGDFGKFYFQCYPIERNLSSAWTEICRCYVFTPFFAQVWLWKLERLLRIFNFIDDWQSIVNSQNKNYLSMPGMPPKSSWPFFLVTKWLTLLILKPQSHAKLTSACTSSKAAEQWIHLQRPGPPP